MESPRTRLQCKLNAGSEKDTCKAPFKYQDLDLSSDGAFRLMELLPGKGLDLIHCRLRHISLKGTTDVYEAVSYAWGDPNIRRPVYLHGCHLEVTSNLESALRHLRLADESRLIWADAICINQTNLPERAQQVQQMWSIFANARRVLVWLGEADRESDNAIEFVNSVCDALYTHGNSLEDEVEIYQRIDAWLPVIETFVSSEHLDDWLSLKALISRPWWYRLWVYQEIVSASAVDFQCGRTVLPFLRFMNVLLPLHFLSSQDRLPRSLSGMERQLASTSAMGVARTQRLELGYSYRGQGMLYWMLASHLRECEDPRDRVYAILGLLDAHIRKAITVDYSQSLSWVHSMATKTYIEVSQKLEILCYAGTESNPSWAPDWGKPIMRCMVGAYITSPHYSASAESPAMAQFSDDLQTLRVNGISLDTILENNFQRSKRRMLEIPERHGSYTWNLQEMAGQLSSYRESLGSSEGSGFENRSKSVTTGFCSKLKGDQHILEEVFRVMTCDQAISPTLASKRQQELVLARDLITNEMWPVDRATFFQRAESWTTGRTVIVSHGGLVGLAPRATLPGDIICVLAGLSVPAILRRRDDGAYASVGDAYVHGVMDGETIKAAEAGELFWEDFDLR